MVEDTNMCVQKPNGALLYIGSVIWTG